MSDFAIRKARPEDRSAIIDICIRTADKGGDGRYLFSQPDYPALLWALPYFALEPDHALVLTTGTKVVGYAVGTSDTASFASKLEHDWWPKLRKDLSANQPVTADDRYVFGYIEKPERVPAEIAKQYPAHLHINLLPEAQGSGLGSQLLDSLLVLLAKASATGVHLGVNHQNEAVTAFYRKLGFVEIARLPSIIMAKPLKA
ncbi:MAG: GNAT family N-acetyltransferase [Martelella sp.]|uniref:GNAT family N-acetyltransferase n=1 Tax=Martelella sp. TaxID=1969699 RepID=UPI003242EFB0